MKRLREVRRVIKSNINKTFMKEGSYEEIQYGDERVILNKKEGRIEHSQRRTNKQYEDSAKMVAYSLLGLACIIIVLMIIM